VGEDGEELVTLGERTGVVLSGGGADGAYEVGVLKALTHGVSPATGYRPVDPEVYTGTSVGAFNAAYMASRPGRPATAVTAELDEIWMRRVANTPLGCGNGVFRVRGLPLQFLDPGCLLRPFQILTNSVKDSVDLAAFSAVKGAQFVASDTSLQSRLLSLIDLQAFISPRPIDHLVTDEVSLEGLRRSDKRLTIAASNWELGVLRLFSKDEIVDTVGTDAILASAAIPGIFAPVSIGGVPYVDGGVLLNTPLLPAIREGATTIHVIFLDPLLPEVRLKPLPSTLDTAWRMLAIMWASSMRKDILNAAAVNLALEVLKHGLPESAVQGEERTLLHVAGQMYRRLIEGGGRPYRELTVHIFRPRSALGEGEGILDFQSARLRWIVDMGYRDAIHHDCAAEGCVLPGRHTGQEGDR
jgi:NTE family protein